MLLGIATIDSLWLQVARLIQEDEEGALLDAYVLQTDQEEEKKDPLM